MESSRRESDVLRAVGTAAERLLAAADWRSVADEVLAELGRATYASRAHIYSVTAQEDDTFSTLLFEWIGGDVRPVIDEPEEQLFPLRGGGYGRWIDILGSGSVIQGLRSEFPESERSFLENEGIQSVLVVPVFAEGRWWGWIGFDDVKTERRWSDAETDALRTAAGVLGAAIQRERMEEGRLAAEAKYRSLVEQLPGITYLSSLGPEDSILYMSPQVHELLGYSAADWIKTPGLWAKSLHPDDRDRVLAASHSASETGEPFTAEYRILTRYGREIWIHDEGTLIRHDDGTPMYWQGIMLDITAQKAAEAKAAASVARFQALVEHIPAVTYEEETEGPLRYISPQVLELTGYTAAEWLNTPGLWRSIIHPDDKELVLDNDARVERTGERFVLEYRLRHKDGRDVWVRDESALVDEPAGDTSYWQGVMLDVTAEHEARQAAIDAEDRFRLTAEQVPAAITIDALEGRATGIYMSPQIQLISGYTAEEWLADPDLWEHLIHPDDRQRVLAADDISDQTGAPFDVEYRLVAKDDRVVWVHETMRLRRDDQGEPMYWQGAILDITDTRRAGELEWALEMERGVSQKLRDLDVIKNTYLTTIAHDLRTPLSVILGLALTMQRSELELDRSEIVDFSSRIAQHARKLDRMVKDLLDLEKLSGGTMGLERNPTDISTLVARIVKEADYLEGHPVTVGVPALTVIVDPGKVERIVENLLVNAANHTPPATPIWIGASRDGEDLLLRVDDAGPGVPEDQREEIFAPFVQGLGSTGSGVGLSLVARLAELHGGRAWVEERDGGGASFRVQLACGD